jgi:hypothetical protein
MALPAFDTHAYVKRLIAVGVPESQAEAQVELQTETLSEWVKERVATKEDIAQLKGDIQELNLKMAELKAEMIKWVLGISVAQAAIIISCIKFIR